MDVFFKIYPKGAFMAEKKMGSVIERACNLRGRGETKPKPEIRVHAWLETKEGLLFGVGRAELLDKIEELGSLRKAAEEMSMSYRAAWGKIKRTEEILGFKLIEKERGNKTGFQLTEAGRALKANYRNWYRAIETEAVRTARELFPWTMTTRGRKRSSCRVSKESDRTS
jgi:molybdate transport system regulatory protein